MKQHTAFLETSAFYNLLIDFFVVELEVELQVPEGLRDFFTVFLFHINSEQQFKEHLSDKLKLFGLVG